MGETTGISWTDHTFNPWWGCTEVSPGCDNCYARVLATRYGFGWGKGAPRRTFGDKHWNEPVKWNRSAELAGVRRFVFVASMSDVMDDDAPAGEFERLCDLIDRTPWLIYQLLTKRPHRYLRRLPAGGFRHDNALLGATMENQKYFDVRMPLLKQAADRHGLQCFVSYEPALGPVRLKGWRPDWLIFGGETGADKARRPMQQAWAEYIKTECEDAGVRFFMKQMSARTPAAAAALIPAELLLREMPVLRTVLDASRESEVQV